jgi:hypothetical protein
MPIGIPEFHKNYYFKHQVLNHGTLTAVVYFQRSSTPWSKLQIYNSSYFGWLHNINVFLNETNFKSFTLLACGFLAGIHHSHLH